MVEDGYFGWTLGSFGFDSLIRGNSPAYTHVTSRSPDNCLVACWSRIMLLVFACGVFSSFPFLSLPTHRYPFPPNVNGRPASSFKVSILMTLFALFIPFIMTFFLLMLILSASLCTLLSCCIIRGLNSINFLGHSFKISLVLFSRFHLLFFSHLFHREPWKP